MKHAQGPDPVDALLMGFDTDASEQRAKIRAHAWPKIEAYRAEAEAVAEEELESHTTVRDVRAAIPAYKADVQAATKAKETIRGRRDLSAAGKSELIDAADAEQKAKADTREENIHRLLDTMRAGSSRLLWPAAEPELVAEAAYLYAALPHTLPDDVSAGIHQMIDLATNDSVDGAASRRALTMLDLYGLKVSKLRAISPPRHAKHFMSEFVELAQIVDVHIDNQHRGPRHRIVTAWADAARSEFAWLRKRVEEHGGWDDTFFVELVVLRPDDYDRLAGPPAQGTPELDEFMAEIGMTNG